MSSTAISPSVQTHPGRGRRTALAALAAGALVLPLLLTACGGAPAGDGPVDDAPVAEATGETPGSGVQRYEVRGEVTSLPDPGDPLSNLVIRHEAIDDFVGIDGEVVGMSSMSMPFPLGDGASLEGVEVGDRVAFTLEVEWEGDPAYRIVRIEELPAGTELGYRKARPPAAPDGDAGDGGAGDAGSTPGAEPEAGT